METFHILITPLEALMLVAVPVVLIRLGLIPVHLRLAVLALATVLVSVAVFLRGGTLVQIGVQTESWAVASAHYALYVLVAGCALMVIARLVRTVPVRFWWKNPHFLFFFIPISAVQQLLFQSIFLTSFVAATGSTVFAVASVAFLFGLMHVIYPRPLLSFFLSAAGGVCFAVLFLMHGNIWIAILGHSVLNFIAVQRSLFSLLHQGTKQDEPN